MKHQNTDESEEENEMWPHSIFIVLSKLKDALFIFRTFTGLLYFSSTVDRNVCEADI
jgi:hypothetical protein